MTSESPAPPSPANDKPQNPGSAESAKPKEGGDQDAKVESIWEKPWFRWFHAILALGIFAALGVGMTALFKKATVVYRFKAWICKIAAQEYGSEKKDNLKPTPAEEAATAAKAAAAAAADVARASQEMLNSKSEERKYFEAFMGLLAVQVEEMKSIGKAIRKLEANRENASSATSHAEERVQYAAGNGMIDNTWRNFSSNQVDPRPSHSGAKQVKVNGTADADFGSVRPSSAPPSTEPTMPPHPKSYMEIMAMVQRGEKPPGIKEINDKPHYPNQPPSNPSLAPRAKPWEVGQVQHSSGYGLHSELRGEGSGFQGQDGGTSSQLSGSSSMGDNIEPWWRQKGVKITEIEPEKDRTRTSYSGMGADERPVQRGWVPPQPPPVSIPEAAAAIRQPKPPIQRELSVDEQLTVPSDNANDETHRIAKASDSEVKVESSSLVSDLNPSIRHEEQNGIVEVN